MPIGIEGTYVQAATVMHVVELHFRVPRFHVSRALHDGQTKHALHELEQAGDHSIHREVWPQQLLVEAVATLSHLLRPIRDFPRREAGDGSARLRPLELLELAILAFKGRGGAT